MFSVKNIYLKFYYFIKKRIFILRGIINFAPFMRMWWLLQRRGYRCYVQYKIENILTFEIKLSLFCLILPGFLFVSNVRSHVLCQGILPVDSLICTRVLLGRLSGYQRCCCLSGQTAEYESLSFVKCQKVLWLRSRVLPSLLQTCWHALALPGSSVILSLLT